MKFAHVVTALALAASAGAQAQPVVDMNARLAASGSLVSSVNLQVDGGCPKASPARWNLLITSANAPTLAIPVTVNSLAGICE